MAFLPIRIPVNIERGSKGGPLFDARITKLASGFEKVHQLWAKNKMVFDIGYGIQNGDDLEEILTFFMVVNGPNNQFLYKDWLGYKIENQQLIATGDGTTTAFQIIKTYSYGGYSYDRPVYHPISGTLEVYESAVQGTEGVDYTVDYTTGVITFTSPPAMSAPITVNAEFDIRVRFMDKNLDITQLVFDQTGKLSGSAPSIPLISVRVRGGLL